MIYEYEFQGRKPSLAQVQKIAFEAFGKGYEGLELSWGENWISLEDHNGTVIGSGWIKAIGGDDLAQLINAGRK